jgi:hypothetical protein
MTTKKLTKNSGKEKQVKKISPSPFELPCQIYDMVMNWVNPVNIFSKKNNETWLSNNPMSMGENKKKII